MSGMFEGCGVFNQDISDWNVSSVTKMSSMFKDATAFNQDLGAVGGAGWDVGLVEYMNSMFEGATNFNGDITSWDVKKVVSMQAMFKNATSFNKALKWYTSSVTDLSFMFEGATAFNSDVQFFTDNVSTVEAMFKNATSFNKLICKGVATIPYGGKVNFRVKVWHMGRFSSTPQGNMSNRQRPKTGVSNLVSMFEGATNFGKEWSKKDEKRMLAWNIIPNAQLTNMFKNTYIISNSPTLSLTKNAPNWEVVKIFNNFREVSTRFYAIADI
jgi:surface protein